MGQTMPKLGPGERFKLAMAVHAGAAVVDTVSVASWLTAFTKTHVRYLDAQAEVESQEKLVALAEREMFDRNAKLNHSLVRLRSALVVHGYGMTNPLQIFKVPSAAVLMRQAIGRKVAIMRDLAQRVRLRPNCNAEMLLRVDEIHAAAAAVQSAMAATNEARAVLQTKRLVRDAIGRQWDQCLKLLRHAAAESTEPHLAQVLFAPLKRVRKK